MRVARTRRMKSPPRRGAAGGLQAARVLAYLPGCELPFLSGGRI